MKTKLFVFSPFVSDEDTFDSNLKERMDEIISYSVKCHSNAVGEFSLTVSQSVNIIPDDIIRIVDAHREWWLIARNISFDDENMTMTVTGCDLKGLLLYRICLYASEAQDVGTYGYDVVQGFTGYCCAHYVKNNCTEPEVPQRKIYGLQIDESFLQVGNPNATYRARFGTVAETVQNICENDGMCWDIVGDLTLNKFVFKVYPPIQRTSLQTTENQVVFSISRKNVSSFHRELGNSEYKNVFYATKSGGTLESDAYTAIVYRDESEIPSGMDRKEMQLNVSCDEFSEVDMYALHEATEYVETDSIKIDVTYVDEFCLEYFIGDRITVYDTVRKAVLHTNITSAEYSASNSEQQLSLTFGKEKPKPLKKIINKFNNGVK